MLRAITRTTNDFALTILRWALGLEFFAHGAQKVLGWWGGAGFQATMHGFTTGMKIPAPLAFLAITAEFLGGIELLLGLLSRIAAFGIGVNMVVAITMVSRHFGLFMNWGGHQRGEGFEYHLLAIAISVMIMAKGSGALSLDRLLYRQPAPARVGRPVVA